MIVHVGVMTSPRQVGRLMQRLGTFSERTAYASDMLRTRIDVALAAQNCDPMQSMNHRTRMQLRLPQTVELFSIAAIT